MTPKNIYMKQIFFALLAMLLIISCSQDEVPAPPANNISQDLRGLEGARQRLSKIVAQPEFRSQLISEDNPMGLAVVTESTILDRHGDPLTFQRI